MSDCRGLRYFQNGPSDGPDPSLGEVLDAVACQVRVDRALHILPLDQWDPEWRYRYEERAGIKEFDGGMPRYRAETEALEETWAEYMVEF